LGDTLASLFCEIELVSLYFEQKVSFRQGGYFIFKQSLTAPVALKGIGRVGNFIAAAENPFLPPQLGEEA